MHRHDVERQCFRLLYRRPKSLLLFFMLTMTYFLGIVVQQTLTLLEQQEPREPFRALQLHSKPLMVNMNDVTADLSSFFAARNQTNHYGIPAFSSKFQNKLKFGYLKNSSLEEEPVVVKTLEHVGGNCVPAAPWQTMSFPTCNTLHEIDFLSSLDSARIKVLSQGHHRTVWKLVESNGDHVVVKTLRLYREFVEKNYEMHRLDAILMEQLTYSPHVADVYGFCGQSVLNEFGLGNLVKANQIFGKKYTWTKKLELAHDAVAGIADMHSMGGKKATFVHRDLGAANVIVSKDKRLKLNDFNSAQMLFWDKDNGRMCSYRDLVSCSDEKRRADTRSPEECLGKNLTEKVDVYAIAPIIFRLLTGVRMYHYDKKQAVVAADNDRITQVIVAGDTAPRLPSKIENSTDPAVAALRNAMKQALTHDPDARPSATEIAQYLKRAIRTIKRQDRHTG